MPRATAARILLLAVAGGILADIVVPGNAAGLNAPLLVAALLVAALLVAGRDGLRRMDPADAWLAPAALALAAMAAVRADPWLVTADLLLAAALAAGSIACLGGGRVTRGLVPQVLALTAGVIAAALAGAAEVLAGLRRAPVAAWDAGAGPATSGGGIRDRLGRRLRRAAPVLRGLVIAVPLVVVFAALFASADAVFDRLARQALDWRLDLDLAGLADRSLVVGLVAWLAAGLLALAGARLPALAGARWPAHAMPGGGPDRGRSLGAARAAVMARESRLGTVEAATVLVVLDALFAVFVVLQLAYLFGGRDTPAAVGLTYAEYARRGFFELVAVAVLAGSLVVALDLAVGRRSVGQLAAALGLLGLTAVVLASALLRLRLYQDAYGWTELRFVVLVAIGWLAAAVVVTSVLLATRRTRWSLHVLGIMVLATVAGMNVVGPQAFVADRNLERALDPSLVPPGGRTGLDTPYLSSLGDEAVPAVARAVDRLPDPADRVWLERFLDGRAAELRENPTLLGWPAWNLARERARAALADR
ncbi:MAG: DUF4173 domain-containing protein [Chloroflexota bacterium]